MLPLLLLLVSEPAAQTPPALMPDVTRDLRTLDRLAGVDCANARLHRIEQASATPFLQTDLTYRPDGSVRRYLLLERSIGGCSVPISFALPGRQGDIIRQRWRMAPVAPNPDRAW